MSAYGIDFSKEIGITFTRSLLGVLEETTRKPMPERIIYNDITTIVYWKDGTKTLSRCMESDEFNQEAGFLACLAKKIYGGHNQYKKFIRDANVQE